MAYSPTTSPPRMIRQAPGGGRREWEYESADAAATVAVSGYISDGGKYGMQVGDLVTVFDSATPKITTHQVITVSATTGAVDLSDASTVGTNTNSG